MAESNDVPTLKTICTEVVETQFKVILSSQCIKAQDYLVDKLRKQSEQQKQVYNSISNGNSKLETEIKTAEQEVQSLQHADDTIKAANVELMKDLLLAKERKVSVTERANNGIKKYNELWRVSKQRYESIPLIKNYLQAKEKNKTLEESILNLTNEAQKLRNDIKIRTVLDRKNIIELANFMIHERPQMLQRIQEKNCEVVKLLNDIKNITKEDNKVLNKTATSAPTEMDIHIEDAWPNLTTDNAMVMPKLQLRIDEELHIDSFSIKLDQIKKLDSQSGFRRTEKGERTETLALDLTLPTKKIRSDETIKKLDSQRAFKRTEKRERTETLALDLTLPTKKMRSDETVRPSYFNSPKTSANDTGTNECHRKSYSEKLIHTQEDIKLDSVETYNIVSNVKPSSLEHVDAINPELQKEPINSEQCDQEKVIDKTQKDIPVSGFLFTHGPQGITDSLNYSSSMTGPSYFNSPKKSANDTGPNECHHKISEKKLMHILEDIKLDSVETYNIVSNVKPSALKHVYVINPDVQKEPINSKKCDQEKRIQEKNCEVVKLLNDIKNITKEDNTVSNKTATSAPTGMDIHIEDSWPNLTTDNAMVMPKLQLRIDEELDIDSFSIKLDQIKKLDSQSAFKRTEKRERTETLALDLTLPTKKIRSDETVRDVYVPSYFKSPKTSANDTGTNECHRKSYSEKLIHTQEDIKLDSVETYNIVSNVKPSSLEHVDVINPELQKEPINSEQCDQEKVIDKTQKDIPVSGFLFTHGPQGITDSLNYSSSMTGPSYFNSPKKSANDTGPNECHHKISEKKLMHILEDIKLDSAETYNIVSNVKPSALKHVYVINPDVQKEPINSKKCDQEKRIQEKNCEVVKLLNDIKNITKEDNTVSNKTATSAPTGMDIHKEDAWPNLTTDNAMVMPKLQLRIDEELDIDSFSIKLDQIKKLDSQSGFRRTEKGERTETLALDLTLPTKKMRSDETVRPSYFNSPKTSANDTGTNECHRKSYSEKLIHTQEDIKLDSVEPYNIVSNVKPSSLEHVDVINPELQKEPINSEQCDQEKVIDKTQKDIPVSGFLFTHGPQGITDSLNYSSSMTGIEDEDTDADYPHCIDSSLLLSPKADIELPTTSNNNNQQVLSQDVPNFLSGMKQIGFSFFEKPSSKNRPDTSEKNQNSNFTFSFGRNEKKK